MTVPFRFNACSGLFEKSFQFLKQPSLSYIKSYHHYPLLLGVWRGRQAEAIRKLHMQKGGWNEASTEGCPRDKRGLLPYNWIPSPFPFPLCVICECDSQAQVCISFYNHIHDPHLACLAQQFGFKWQADVWRTCRPIEARVLPDQTTFKVWTQGQLFPHFEARECARKGEHQRDSKLPLTITVIWLCTFSKVNDHGAHAAETNRSRIIEWLVRRCRGGYDYDIGRFVFWSTDRGQP